MLPDWQPDEPVDLLHTMEVLYLDEPRQFLTVLHNHWLKPGGRIVVGVDHYVEVIQSRLGPS